MFKRRSCSLGRVADREEFDCQARGAVTYEAASG